MRNEVRCQCGRHAGKSFGPFEQWHAETLDRYAWEVKYHQRDEDMRVLIMARAVREQLEQCVTEMRAIVGWRCNGDGDVNDSDADSLTSIRALILAGLHEPSS
jgi:hypothetical protein